MGEFQCIRGNLIRLLLLGSCLCAGVHSSDTEEGGDRTGIGAEREREGPKNQHTEKERQEWKKEHVGDRDEEHNRQTFRNGFLDPG